MTYGDFKDLTRRTSSDKVLRDKAFNIARNPIYDGYYRGLASMVDKFFDKKSTGSGVNIHANNERPLDLAKELHKPIIRKFKKRAVYSGFKDNIWGADLADMQLISKFNKGFRFLLCVIDIFSKYAWVVPLKDKKGVSIVDAFQKILDKSARKPNKIWVNKGNYFRKWLKDNNIEMYSINNEGKSVFAERFIRTVKNKNYKYMTAISKNVYIDKLDDIVNEYNNTYYRTIKMKPVDVKDNIYIDSTKLHSDKKVHNKDRKFKVGDHVKISKYKSIFAKGYTPNWYEEIFVIKKVENTVPWTYVINDLNGDEIIETFYEKELQNTNQQEFRIEKVIKKVISYMTNGKVMVIHLIAGLIKKT